MEKERVFVVLPAYNCAETLEQTINAIPHHLVDEIIMVDDNSTDESIKVAQSIGIKHIFKHDVNKGYGANQKTCYKLALDAGADIIIMLHPDYQYDPSLIKDIITEFNNGASVVFASRMQHGAEALRCGMPLYNYISNRFLTAFQNFLFNKNLSEYHTGYRAFRKSILQSIDLQSLSDDFIFDNQIILELFKQNVRINEIYCPARYLDNSSSINLLNSLKYGINVLFYSIKYKYFI